MSFQFDISPTGVLSHAQSYYNPNTHKVVPKDAIVLDLEALSRMDLGPSPAELPQWLRSVAAANKNGKESLGSVVTRLIADQISAQTKPPRIPEPGLWGVVSASRRPLSTRVEYVRTERGWERTGLVVDWDELLDPTLVRPGVE